MANLDQQKPGEKSARRKQKRNKKAEQKQNPAQAGAEPIETAAIASADPVAGAAAVEAASNAPVERVASFRERMAAVTPPADTAAAKAAEPADVVQAAPTPAAAVGIQAIANAYRDYTQKSLADAQSFAERLSSARSLDKAVEAQTEFARKACETFAADARKIRELHRELFWQAFRLPTWPPGRTQR